MGWLVDFSGQPELPVLPRITLNFSSTGTLSFCGAWD